MFNPADPPMRIEGQPQLGDHLIGLAQALPVVDLSMAVLRLHEHVLRLEQRVDRLEAQTPRACWRRFCAWVRQLWP